MLNKVARLSHPKQTRLKQLKANPVEPKLHEGQHELENDKGEAPSKSNPYKY